MKQSVQLATFVQKQFRSTARRVDRGVRQAGFLVLHATSMPSVLIELGYISTPEDEKYLNSQAGINALSRSICQAVLQYKKAQTGTASALAMIEPVEAAVEIEIPDIQPETTTEKAKVDTEKVKADTSRSPVRSQGTSRTATPAPAGSKAKPQTTNNTEKNAESQNSKPVFKVQILTSSTLLKKDDRKLKGFNPVSYYKENGIYKYTYGESTNYNEILRLKNKASTTFKDAFIIAFRNGKKMDVREAIQEFKRNR